MSDSPTSPRPGMAPGADTPASAMDRKRFLKLAAAAAATGGVTPATLEGETAAGAAPRPRSQEGPPPVPLGNAEPPAMQFQAWPGGTGAYLERLWQESGGSPFERTAIELPPWEGPLPATEEDLAYLPAHRLAALIREGHVTSVEATDIYLDRLERYDPVLLFAVNILEGRAREEAQQADADLKAGIWRGPLHGVPYGVKDLFGVEGAPTTWGHADYAARVLDGEAEVVVRLREAGAVLLAKLATGEFARGDRWYRGRTLNPWNPEQGSSGSSAGPGSATAAGCVAFAIGTETQGSIVSPARRNGICALRPTFGRVSRHGGMVLSWSMDKVGPMCRSALDCALVFHAIHGSDPRDPATLTAPFRFDPSLDLGDLRIGYTEDAPETFLAQLRELGAAPRPMGELPRGRSNALSVESAAAFDFRISKEPEPPPTQDEREARRRARFRRGRDVSALEYLQSQRRRHVLMREMADAMDGWDMFVSGSGHVGLTNQTGHPAVVLPYDFGGEEHQQPICTTLVGDLFADDRLLSVAHAFQRATDWHERRPELS